MYSAYELRITNYLAWQSFVDFPVVTARAVL
jgi:hypothetical protein